MAVSPAGLTWRQRGVALVTALLVVALATVAAVAMASRQQLDVRRTANLLDGDQAYAYSVAVEGWARMILNRDDTKGVDALNDHWAQRLPPIPVTGGQIDGFISDLQGRFNLNNLIDANGQPSPPHQEYFRNLLNALQLNPDLAFAVLDWIDKDTTPASYSDGAEDDYYLVQELPYRTANDYFQSISELRLVKGFDAEVWNKLAPHVCALPKPTTLNINTAGAVLLQALDPGFTAQDGEQLVETRPTEGYTDVNDLFQLPNFAGWQGGAPILGILGVASEYFLVRSDVVIGTARSRTFSLVERGANDSQVLARTQGTW